MRDAAPCSSPGGEAMCSAARCSHPPHQGTVHGAAHHQGSSEQQSSLTGTRPTALHAGCDAECKSAGMSTFRLQGASPPLTRPDTGLSVARGPRGETHTPAVRSCYPNGRFPPLCKKKASNIWGCAGCISSCSSDGFSWAIFERVSIKLTSLSVAWPWLGGFERLVGPIARAGGLRSRRTPHAMAFSAVGKVDFACDWNY